jgi:hypothetical protein
MLHRLFKTGDTPNPSPARHNLATHYHDVAALHARLA